MGARGGVGRGVYLADDANLTAIGPMIVYDLTCAVGHRFESWFPTGAAFDSQQADGAVVCPLCGNREIGKAPMAPRIARGAAGPAQSSEGSDGSDATDGDRTAGSGASRGTITQAPSASPAPAAPAAMFDMLRQLRRHIENNCDYVGTSFPEEARRIYYGEVSQRDIYGEASPEEVAELKEEGIETQRIPWLPRRDA